MTKANVEMKFEVMNCDLKGEVDAMIQNKIYASHGVQVMLDRDLAMLYGVDTGQFNRQVKRNIERFPPDFMFQLTKKDVENLKCQFGISSWGGDRHLPYAFTENGIAMLSGVLRSPTAIEANIRIMRTFVAMRRAIASLAPLLTRIETVERRQITDQAHNDERFVQILDAMHAKKFPTQQVFFDGQFFDAFVQMKRFVRQAKRSLVIIDPYFDDSCLPLIAQKRNGVAVTVVVCARGHRNLHQLDVAQFNLQYANSLTVKETEKFHDRYLIIDGATLIHVGASLNYLGKKCFAFATLAPEFIPDILARIP